MCQQEFPVLPLDTDVLLSLVVKQTCTNRISLRLPLGSVTNVPLFPVRNTSLYCFRSVVQ